MEEFKGTKGPWKYDGNKNGLIDNSEKKLQAMTYPMASVNFEEMVCNAHLIAAAPEMLQALQLMISAQVLPVYHQTIANAAINKALGK